MRQEESRTSLTDRELVGRFQQQGDQQALVELMRRYTGYVIAFSSQHLEGAEAMRDFSQDLFLKLSEKLAKTEVQNFKAWLYTVMRNMFLDKTRKISVHRKALEALVPKEQGYRIDRDIDLEFFRPELEKALRQLNPQEETCIRAVYLEEKSYAEIMAEQSWTFNQVRGYRQRGIQKLKNQLQHLWTPK